MSETEFRFRSEEDAAVVETGVELPLEDIPTTEGVPVPEDISTSEGVPALEDIPTTEGLPAPEDIPTSEGAPASEELSTTEGVPAPEDIPTTEDIPVPEEISTSEEIPATEDIPVPEDISTPEDIPSTESDLRLRPDDPPAVQAGPSAVQGPEKRTCPSCNQENEIAREFCWACHTILGDQGSVNGAAPQPEQDIPPAQDIDPAQDIPQAEDIPQAPETPPAQDVPAPMGPREESDRREDALVDYGPSVKLAYHPSGQKGNSSTLLFHGGTGFLVGLFKAALVLAAAVVVNIIHNLLPVFFFVLPLVIVGLILLAPAAVGMAVGENVSKGVLDSKCRVPGQAGIIAFLSTVGGLMLFVLIAQGLTAPGESFLFDKMIWFIRLMVGGSVSFDWLAEPEAIGSTYEGIIFFLLGLSALVGAGLAYHTASETVRSVPFCELCGKHMDPVSLWNISPLKIQQAINAFESMNYNEIGQIPQCRMFDNFISVDVWSCTCDSKSILELVGHGVEPPEEDGDDPTVQDPVRIFSRPLTPEQLSQIKA